MRKNLTQLKVTIHERDYQLICDPDSPIEHAREAIQQFIKYLDDLQAWVKSQQEKEESKLVEAA